MGQYGAIFGGHLSWFRYPTHYIGTYLGRGVMVLIVHMVVMVVMVMIVMVFMVRSS